MKLYELPTQYRDLLDWMEEHAEELSDSGGDHPELIERLERIEADFGDKAERVALLIREQEAEAGAYKAEADRLAARARTLSRNADWLKGYLLHQLRRMGETKVHGKLVNVSRVKNGRPSVRYIGDVEKLPQKWQRVRVDFDGQKAYEDLKAAGKIPSEPGAYPVDGLTVEVGEHVRIR